jgi:tetratricopeptide (TPR) repeat protein
MKKQLILLTMSAGIANVTVFASKGQITEKEQEDVYWKGLKYYQEEDYAKAVLMFQYLLNQDSGNADINYYTGICFLNLNKPKLARWHFSKAMADNFCRMKILLLPRVKGDANLCIDF